MFVLWLRVLLLQITIGVSLGCVCLMIGVGIRHKFVDFVDFANLGFIWWALLMVRYVSFVCCC